MGKEAVRMKAVIYSLSPYQQKVMPGLWKDLPGKISHKISNSWINMTCMIGPVVATVSFANWYDEKKKMHHRD